MKPANPRRELILNAAVATIKSIQEWTVRDVAAAMSMPKSMIHHYWQTKAGLARAVWAHYAKQTRNVYDITVDLAMWVAMREDPDLAREIRRQRADERAFLQIEFEGIAEARLAQALRVGLGVMRELGLEVDEAKTTELFRELVFANHARNRSSEAKGGVDAGLSA
jgi:AcrR family transcriptional regulator